MGQARTTSWHRLNPREVLVFAIAFGLAAGFLEASRAVVADAAWHRPTGELVSSELLWMAPVAATATLLGVGLLLIVGARLTRRSAVLASAPMLFSIICVASFLRSLSAGLHTLAILILAAGVGAVVSRNIAKRPTKWRRGAGRIALSGVTILGLWAVWVPVSRRLAERSLTANLPPPQDGPNVLLIVWDAVRAASLSLYGYERPTTPTLERLAGSSLVFDRAITTAPWTLPSHASLFTGLFEHQHGATRGSPLDESHPTLAEAMAERGYRTGGFAANRYWLGAFGTDRGFQWYQHVWYRAPPGSSPLGQTVKDVLLSWRATKSLYRRAGGSASPRRVEDPSAAIVSLAFLDWLERTDSARPFFAFLNFMDAHEPYSAPEPTGYVFSTGQPLRVWDTRSTEPHTEAELLQLREAYDASIRYLDSQLAELLARIAKLGLAESTLLVVTADHGETIGEHAPNLLGHSKYAYFDVLNVPLMIHAPGRFRGGARYGMPVSTVDVPATILEIVDGAAGGFSGHSLLPLVEGTDSHRSPAFSQATPADWQREFPAWPVARGPLYSLVDGDLHYVVNAFGEEALYDIANDPGEQHDLSASPEVEPELRRMREAVQPLIDATPGAPAVPN